MSSGNEDPYLPPAAPCSLGRTHTKRNRWAFLALPAGVPPGIHLLARSQIAASEDVAHSLCLWMGMLIGWVWTFSLVDRLELGFLRSYLLACAVAGAVLASAVTTASIGLP